MLQQNFYLFDFIVYFCIIFLISFFASRATKDHHDFILAGRRLNSWIVALGVGASDMSGWLLMGLPGAVMLFGLNQIWMSIGLIVGAYCNWFFVAKRLRITSEERNNASTIPAFIENSFENPKIILLITAVTLIFFFSIYAASGFVSGALLFQTIFNLSYMHSLLITFSTIVLYTFIGGFIAVSWVDFFQGTLMLFALLIVPFIVFFHLHATPIHPVPAGFLHPLHHMNLIGILSLLGWGLGYFGQPHILVRFMAIKTPEKLAVSRRTAMSWMCLCLFGAVFCGIMGAYYFGIHGLNNSEAVFLSLTKVFFTPLLGGILFAAVLSAIMSTIAAQLLIASSAIAQDLLWKYCFPDFSHQQLLWLNRFALLAIAFFAMYLARSPDSSILNLVSYAWAGLGAAFGPLIIMLAYSKKITELAAISSILVGAITVVAWKHLAHFGGIFQLYEIIPGFIFSWICLLAVNKRPLHATRTF